MTEQILVVDDDARILSMMRRGLIEESMGSAARKEADGG